MRGFARSMLAADAVRTRSTGELRVAIGLAYPGVDIEDALAQIWQWWRRDREDKTA